MNTLDKQYTDLLQDILDNGTTKQDRTGTGTLSVFGRQIRHKMSEGFPLLTTKKMPFKTITTELLWFLRGDTNIKYLVDNNCHIWDGDAYKNYLKEHLPENGTLTVEEFIALIKQNEEPVFHELGELGPIYGKQWRQWKQFIPYDVTEENCKVAVQVTDQIQNLINDLKTNPDSRRLMVSAWNVGELDQMTLPPCHYGFQVYTRELSQTELNILYNKRRGVGEVDAKYTIGTITAKDPNIPRRAISLMWNQRSVDTFLGLPFNIASYGLLLEIIAKEVNMVPDELIGNLGDTHLYLNHIEQAKEQIGRELSLDERYNLLTKQMTKLRAIIDEDYIKYNIPTQTREPFPLPKLNIKLHFNNEPSFVPEKWLVDDFEIVNYQSHPTIKAPLSN
jgi:thymidylate synthase